MQMQVVVLPTHSLGGFVCVFTCSVVLTTLLISVSLQRHRVAPFKPPTPWPPLPPFHSASFCLSVSYLIELAQKQSKWRYLRARAWCPAEVSPLFRRLCPRCSRRPFKRMRTRGWAHQRPPFTMISCLFWVGTTSDTHTHTRTHILLPAFKQVSWLISDTHSK